MQSSISSWLSIRLIGVLLVIMAFIAIPTFLLLDSYFKSYEEKTLIEQSDRTLLILQNNQNQLNATTRDYAEWDETYQFNQQLLKGIIDSDYVAENFSLANFKTLQVNFVMILDSNYSTIYKKAYNENDKEITLEEPTDFKQKRDTNDHTPHIHWIHNTPVLIAEHRILNPNTGQKSGTIFFGTILDSTRLLNIQEISGIEFHILRQIQHQISTQTHDADCTEHDIHRENNLWVSHQQVNPYFAIAVFRNPLLLKESYSTYALLTINTLIQLLILIFATRYFLNKGILNRIKDFANQALQFGEKKDYNIRWQSQKQDEIGQLAISLNSMMHEIRSQNEAIEYLANNDHLTELHNRRSFMNRLQGALILKKFDPSLVFCVAMMDLDGFKLVNDQYGHDAGDFVLKIIAERVRNLLRHEDIFARLGGDEFAFIFTSSTIHSTWELSNQIRKKIEEVIVFNESNLFVSCSIGLCNHDQSPEATTLLKFCDIALYQAKNNGKRQSCIYQNELLGNYTI